MQLDPARAPFAATSAATGASTASAAISKVPEGFQLYYVGTERSWTAARAALKFAKVTQDGGGEGFLKIDRLLPNLLAAAVAASSHARFLVSRTCAHLASTAAVVQRLGTCRASSLSGRGKKWEKMRQRRRSTRSKLHDAIRPSMLAIDFGLKGLPRSLT